MAHSNTNNIKNEFSNRVHRVLEPNIEVKRRERDRKENRKKYDLTDKEKIEKFDEIVKIHAETSNRLTSWFQKRRQRRKVEKLRVLRGYQAKRKTTIAEYREQQENKNVLETTAVTV